MASFGETERKIISLFPIGTTFNYQGEEYVIMKSGKPKPSKGECKTDIYLLAIDANKGIKKEFKISVKQPNADFLENKTSLDRAVSICGYDKLIESVSSLKDKFEEDYLIHFKSGRKTEAKTMRIGWKFELMNKLSGRLSAEIPLSEAQILDVYAGTTLPSDKKDCLVNRDRIENSGTAEYIWIGDINTINRDTFFDEIAIISDYIQGKTVYFACKAVNYRAVPNKWDGNRPLSAYIDWSIVGGFLKADVICDRPLVVGANSIGENIRKCLSALKVDASNFDQLKKKTDPSVRSY